MVETVLELFKFILYFNNDTTENFHWTKDKVGQMCLIFVPLATSAESAISVYVTRAVSGGNAPSPWSVCSSMSSI